MTKQTMTMSAVSVLLASLALAGCDRRDETTAARSNDAVVAQNTPAENTAQSADKAADATRQAGRDIADATKSAADQATDKVSDAVITTAVNAELAKDPALSSLRIDVDTDAGRVALKGTAPDPQAKERATQIASNVKGVVSVDNQLTVGGKG